MSVDTILIIYIRLRRRQSNQSNQNDRKRTKNKYPLEQNEYESDNENGCQNLFFDGNKRRRWSPLVEVKSSKGPGGARSLSAGRPVKKMS